MIDFHVSVRIEPISERADGNEYSALTATGHREHIVPDVVDGVLLEAPAHVARLVERQPDRPTRISVFALMRNRVNLDWCRQLGARARLSGAGPSAPARHLAGDSW